ncbi:MAG: hypothetical protein E7214_16575 [Clostridium sp.]|nr:hypothetical protein [Clostridium sp.]
MSKDKKDIKSIYGLSPMQTVMLFNSIKSANNDDDPYFRQYLIDIQGEVCVENLKKSMQLIIERYDILRTAFVYEKVKQPVQVVFNSREISIGYEDLSNLDEEKQKDAIDKMMKEDKKIKFNLSKDVLNRMKLIKLSDKKYKLLWSNHHILMDGWCGSIILNEFCDIYESLQENKRVNLPAVNQYSEYINWLKKYNKNEALMYWKKYLAGYKNKTSIPTNKTNKIYEYNELVLKLNKETTSRLKKFALDNQVTLSIVVDILWGLLLQAYNETNDSMFGMVVSGRMAPVDGIEKMVGLFINTIPMRIKISNSTSFSDLKNQVQQAVIYGEKYSSVLLTEMLSAASINNDMLDHMAVFENYPSDGIIKNKYFSCKFMNSAEKTNYDFNVLFYPGDEIEARFTYNKNMYSEEIIKVIISHLEKLSNSIIKDADKTLLDEKLKKELLFELREKLIDIECADILNEKLSFSEVIPQDEGSFTF